MFRYTYRVFEPCENGFSREVIFPNGMRCFDSLASARFAARFFGRGTVICRYHFQRGLEDKDYPI